MIPFRRRPSVGIAVGFLAGTAAGLRAHPPALLLLGSAAACAAIAGWLAFRPASPDGADRHTVGGTALLLAAVTLTGWLNASLVMRPSVPPLPAAGRMEDRPLEVRGVVADDPLFVRGSLRLTLGVEAYRELPDGPWVEASGEVPANVPASPVRIYYGDRISLLGRLTVPAPPPDRQARALRPRFVADLPAERLAPRQGNPLYAACLRARRTAARIVTHGLEDFPRQCAILRSLLLGYRSQMPPSVYTAFARTNTLHVFAVSGSHVVVVAGLFVFALGAVGLPRQRWFFLLAPPLVVYTAMTGLAPSAVRACLMSLLFWLAPVFRRQSDAISALALAAVAIVAVAPLDLIDPGFVLSFVVSLGLVLFYPVFLAPLKPVFGPDPWMLEPEPAGRRVARGMWMGFSRLLAASAAAWLVSAPLTAGYFGLFTPIGLLGNLVAVPLSSLAILCGALALAGGLLALPLAGLFNHANLALVSALDWSVGQFARVPGGAVDLPPVPLAAVAAAYALLLLWRLQIASTRAADAGYTYRSPSGTGGGEGAEDADPRG